MAQKKAKTTFKSRALATALIFSGGVIALGLVRAGVALLPSEAATNPFLGAWLRVWVFAILAMAAIVVVRVKDVELKTDLVAVLLGLSFAGIVLLGLKNTSYGLNGIGGDQGLQTAQVTKFAELPGAVDFAYKDLPPFYPPAYFFALGKTAGLLGVEPYRMLKYGLIAVAFALPFLVDRFWGSAQPRALSLAAVLSLLLYQDWYKPYEWLALALFVPWWLRFVDRVGTKGRSKPGWILLDGLIGALLFSTYYYWFFIGAIALLIRWIVRKQHWADEHDRSNASWLQRVLVLGGAALFSLPYWGPLVWSMWKSGGWESLQNRYFLAEFNTLHFPFLEFSVSGVVLLAGLVYLLQTFQRNRLAFGLLLLVAAAYAWQLLGYVAFLADSPLLTFKARDFVVYVLGLAALLGAFDLAQNVRGNAKLRRKWGNALVGGVAVLALFIGQMIVAGFADNELMVPALEEEYPLAFLNEYKHLVSDDFRGHVILGSASELSIYLPAYQFISWAAVFSHPAGLYDNRLEFLQELSTLDNPQWFAAALMNNRYSHVDEIVLFPQGGGFTMSYLQENFPERAQASQIVFPAILLDPLYFEKTNLDPYKLFIPIYANNPLGDLHGPEDYDINAPMGLGNAIDFYEFLRRFGEHLSFPEQEGYWALLSDAFGP